VRLRGRRVRHQQRLELHGWQSRLGGQVRWRRSGGHVRWRRGSRPHCYGWLLLLLLRRRRHWQAKRWLLR
jgi:hypothetical protein